MPTVRPTQSLNPLSTPRASVPQTADISQGLGDLGDSLGKIALTEQNQINEIRAEEARVGFSKTITDNLFDPDNGYFNTKGKDAYEGAQGMLKALEEAKQKSGEGLNPAQQSMYSQAAERMLGSARQSILRHASEGKKAWDLSVQQAAAEDALESGPLYFNDDKQLNTSLATLRAATAEAARMEGVGAEMTNERLQSVTSKFYASTINRAMVYDLDRAKALLEKHADRMEPNDLDKAREALREKVQTTQAQQSANDWLAQGLSLNDGMKIASEIKDPNLQKETKATWERTYKVWEQGKADDQRKAFEGFASQIENGDLTYSQIPREQRDVMTAAQRDNLRKLDDERVNESAPKNSEFSVYTHLDELVADGRLREARTYFTENYASLSQADRKFYSKATAKGLADSSIESFFSAKDRFKQAVKDLDLSDSKTAQFQSQFDDWYKRYQRINEKKPSDEEIDKAISGLLTVEGGNDFIPFNESYGFQSPTAGNQLILDSLASEFEKRAGHKPDATELKAIYDLALKRGYINE